MDDIRTICTRLRQLYQKGVENYKSKRLQDLFPFKDESGEGEKTINDYVPRENEKTEEEIGANIPLRYPKVREDPSDFYIQYNHLNQSIMKKRPYDTNESSNEGPFTIIDHVLIFNRVWKNLYSYFYCVYFQVHHRNVH